MIKITKYFTKKPIKQRTIKKIRKVHWRLKKKGYKFQRKRKINSLQVIHVSTQKPIIKGSKKERQCPTKRMLIQTIRLLTCPRQFRTWITTKLITRPTTTIMKKRWTMGLNTRTRIRTTLTRTTIMMKQTMHLCLTRMMKNRQKNTKIIESSRLRHIQRLMVQLYQVRETRQKNTILMQTLTRTIMKCILQYTTMQVRIQSGVEY